LSVEKLDSFIFNVGMVEIISYWKAACSPQIIIKPYKLSEDQILWWKKLYYYGLGEFFYLNSLSTDIVNFVDIVCESENLTKKQNFILSDTYIVPIGGGKDSIVTLELLKEAGEVITPLILNPRGASLTTVNNAGFSLEETIVINRKIDAELLELNEKGFLNGHTPFSALLAFITVMMAVISGKKNIALSNEASANESTIFGQKINHQYSKSFEFEEDFRNYIIKNVCDEVNYFSFLRPLHEIQIAKIFSGFPDYFNIFKSCNVGSKNDIWCCSCPKCLFVYIILSPFLNKAELLTIFGKNLYNAENLLYYFTQLIGEAEIKPFECIGTVEEVNIAVCKVINKSGSKELPYLLNYYKETPLYLRYKDESFEERIKYIEQEHFIDNNLLKLIESKLYDRKLS
jgi:hypothetical protein